MGWCMRRRCAAAGACGHPNLVAALNLVAEFYAVSPSTSKVLREPGSYIRRPPSPRWEGGGC